MFSIDNNYTFGNQPQQLVPNPNDAMIVSQTLSDVIMDIAWNPSCEFMGCASWDGSVAICNSTQRTCVSHGAPAMCVIFEV